MIFFVTFFDCFITTRLTYFIHIFTYMPGTTCNLSTLLLLTHLILVVTSILDVYSMLLVFPFYQHLFEIRTTNKLITDVNIVRSRGLSWYSAKCGVAVCFLTLLLAKSSFQGLSSITFFTRKTRANYKCETNANSLMLLR